jgi:hypothetical protein
VFHFLTDPDYRARYPELTTASITLGGYLILATFAADGTERCSELTVTRYSADELAEQLGAAFTTVTTCREPPPPRRRSAVHLAAAAPHRHLNPAATPRRPRSPRRRGHHRPGPGGLSS